MRRSAARRLLDEIGNDDLRDALADAHLRMTGSKPERIERLVEALVGADRILDRIHIHELKEIARRHGLSVSGSKDETILRLCEHFDADGDLRPEEGAPETSPPAESKSLKREGFGKLFDCFAGHQLKQALIDLEQRHSGSKEKQIETLWESPFSEATILDRFSNPELQEALERSGAPSRGNKNERIARLVESYGGSLGDAADSTS